VLEPLSLGVPTEDTEVLGDGELDAELADEELDEGVAVLVDDG
jgi:hypothetical protein